MKECLVCGNKIDETLDRCPVCNADQNFELPQYGAGKAPVQKPEEPPVSDIPKIEYVFTAPEFAPSGEQEKEKKKDRKKMIKILFVPAALLILTGFYFLILILTRNSFLSGGEKLRSSFKDLGCTFNGKNFTEMEIRTLNMTESSGLYTFEAKYDVLLSNDVLEHRLCLEVKGRNKFPFGWELTDTKWSEPGRETVKVKIDGLMPLIRDEVNNGIPTHRTENFALWKVDQSANSFAGSCVIANTEGAYYTIQGTYEYEGEVLPSAELDHGILDYSITVRQKPQAIKSSYGWNECITIPVYVHRLQDGEVRFQVKGFTGDEIDYGIVRTYEGKTTVDVAGGPSPVTWETEVDTMTGNVGATGKILFSAGFFEPAVRMDVTIGTDSFEVRCNGELMVPRLDEELIPSGAETRTGQESDF